MDKLLSVAPELLQNRFFRIEVLKDAGPRISALIPAGTSQNLLAEVDGFHWDSPYGTYTYLGGHRLWAAPEDPARTYFPETSGVHLQQLADGIRLWREDHGQFHWERAIEIRVEADAPRLHLVHKLRNLAPQPTVAAPWTITVLPLGSRIRVPVPRGELNNKGLLPNRNLVYWPYSNVSDTRLHLYNEFIEVKADPLPCAFKTGVYSNRGWAAAEIGDWLLVKHITPCELDARLDMGANIEVYANQQLIEFEMIGQLTLLQPGETVQHEETWEILPGKLEDLDENGSPVAAHSGKSAA